MLKFQAEATFLPHPVHDKHTKMNKKLTKLITVAE